MCRFGGGCRCCWKGRWIGRSLGHRRCCLSFPSWFNSGLMLTLELNGAKNKRLVRREKKGRRKEKKERECSDAIPLKDKVLIL